MKRHKSKSKVDSGDEAEPTPKDRKNKQRKRLRKLLVPFDEDKLEDRASEALRLLQASPDLLDSELIQLLVAEEKEAEKKEGMSDEYGVGFGEERNATTQAIQLLVVYIYPFIPALDWFL